MAANDESYPSSSSSSESSSSTYDVFLSFRGAETRNNFTGFLHRALKKEGIDAYIDSEDLQSGQEIKSGLLEAIRRSKISIIVFSKGYADSKWCLMELVEIVRCHESNGQVILPTFLDVDVVDVRYQIESFEWSFQKHKKRYDAQTVKRWRDALTMVAGISGYELKQVNGNQSKLIDLVVSRVLSEPSGNRLSNFKICIGLNDGVRKIEGLLNVGSSDVGVGICGTGCISAAWGKTGVITGASGLLYAARHTNKANTDKRFPPLGIDLMDAILFVRAAADFLSMVFTNLVPEDKPGSWAPGWHIGGAKPKEEQKKVGCLRGEATLDEKSDEAEPEEGNEADEELEKSDEAEPEEGNEAYEELESVWSELELESVWSELSF